jgi:hypothetical protein
MRAVVGRMPLWMDEGCDVETAMLTDRDWAEYRAKGLKAHGQKGMRAAGAEEIEGHEEIEGADPNCRKLDRQ